MWFPVFRPVFSELHASFLGLGKVLTFTVQLSGQEAFPILGPASLYRLLSSDLMPWPPCLCAPPPLMQKDPLDPYPSKLATLTFVSRAHSAACCSGLSWGIALPGGPARFPSVCVASRLRSCRAQACVQVMWHGRGRKGHWLLAWRGSECELLVVGNALSTRLSGVRHRECSVRVCQIHEMKKVHQTGSQLQGHWVKAGKNSVKMSRVVEVLWHKKNQPHS